MKVTPFTTKRILRNGSFQQNYLHGKLINPPMLFIKPKKDKSSYNHDVQIEGQNVWESLGQKFSFWNTIKTVNFSFHFKCVCNFFLLFFWFGRLGRFFGLSRFLGFHWFFWCCFSGFSLPSFWSLWKTMISRTQMQKTVIINVRQLSQKSHPINIFFTYFPTSVFSTTPSPCFTLEHSSCGLISHLPFSTGCSWDEMSIKTNDWFSTQSYLASWPPHGCKTSTYYVKEF